MTADVGAPQGVEVRDGLVYIYGDRGGVGVIQPFQLPDSGVLEGAGLPMMLTVAGDPAISHPTGLTQQDSQGSYIGESGDGRAVILKIDWEVLRTSGVLDNAILHRVEDGLAIRGSRPEFVRDGERWLIATSDYSPGESEIRLYDPIALAGSANSAEPGVLAATFRSSPYVQSLSYWEARDLLVLAQNTRSGAGWRLSFVALAASIASGTADVVDVLEPDLAGELEGVHFIDDSRLLLVTSDDADNAYPATILEHAK